jgi:hypothetical protein
VLPLCNGDGCAAGVPEDGTGCMLQRQLTAGSCIKLNRNLQQTGDPNEVAQQTLLMHRVLHRASPPCLS